MASAAASEACARCGKRATSKCGRCKRVGYCGQECQVAHWRSGHKGQCALWTSGAATALAPPKEAEKSATDGKSNNSTGANNSSKGANNSSKGANNSANALRDSGGVERARKEGELFEAWRVQKLLRYKEAKIVSERNTGLANVGNTCFVNSVVQALLGTRALVTHLLYAPHTCALTQALNGKDAGKESDLSSKAPFCVHCALAEVADKLTCQKYAHVTPVALLRALPQLGADFQLGYQADAHEFLSAVLDRLHRLDLPPPPARAPVEEEQTTLCAQLFDGMARCVVRCSACSHALVRSEPFRELSVELPARAFSLEEALATHFGIERLDDYTCEQCKHKGCDRQTLIARAPALLVVQLKRFDALHRKINKDIVFADTLDLAPYRVHGADADASAHYALYAMVVHYGASQLSGHYAAFVRGDDCWRVYDDARVESMPNAAVALKQSPYLLFYERLPAAANPSAPTPSASTSSPSTSASALSSAVILERSSVHMDLDAQLLWVRAQLNGPTNTALSLRVYPSGRLELTSTGTSTNAANSDSSDTPVLRYALPMALHVDEVRATVDASNRVLVRLALALDATAAESADPVTQSVITVLNSDMDVAWSHVDESCDELEVAPILSAEQRLQAAQAAIARVNMSRTESTYGALYSEIERAWTLAKSDPDTLARSYVKPPPANAQRNEPCPCGSGRKFKACHAKAALIADNE